MKTFVRVPRDCAEYPHTYVRVDSVVAVTAKASGASEINLISGGVIRSSLSAEAVLALFATGGATCLVCGYSGGRHGPKCPLNEEG